MWVDLVAQDAQLLHRRGGRLADRGDWSYVQGPDLYFGWIRTDALAPYRMPDAVVVGVPLAPVFAKPSRDADIVDELPAGVPLVGRAAEVRVEELRRIVEDAKTDAKELFRRVCFNALISNIDDHPRNREPETTAVGRQFSCP